MAVWAVSFHEREGRAELMLDSVLYLQVVSTICMAGLIWFVQIVHYPMFANVGAEAFTRYEGIHQRSTTYVVAPLMLVEIATASALTLMSPTKIDGWLIWTGLGLVIVNWATTAFLSVPCHDKLKNGFDEKIHQRLVSTNWIRTVAWSLRGGIVLIQLHQNYSAAGI